MDHPAVRVARHPEWLPLLGAARTAGPDDGLVVVLDGGQTSIKRGVAVIAGGRVVQVRIHPPLPVPAVGPVDLSAEVAMAVAALAREDRTAASEAVFSVASYVHDGQPFRYGASIYEEVDPAAVELRCGLPFRLLHDGSAAWRGTGIDARSAVITLGTWLGVGIGPHPGPLRPLAENFTIDTGGREAPALRWMSGRRNL